MHEKLNQAIMKLEEAKLRLYPTKPIIIIKSKTQPDGQEAYRYISKIKKYTNRILYIYGVNPMSKALVDNLNSPTNPMEILILSGVDLDYTKLENIAFELEI